MICKVIYIMEVRKAAKKKVIFLMAVFSTNKKEAPKKVIFLMASALPPLNGTAIFWGFTIVGVKNNEY